MDMTREVFESVCQQFQAEFPDVGKSYIREIVNLIMIDCGGRKEDVRDQLGKRYYTFWFWRKVKDEIKAQAAEAHEALITLTPIHFVTNSNPIPTGRIRANILRRVRTQLRKYYQHKLRAGQFVNITMFNGTNWNMKIEDRHSPLESLQKQFYLMARDEKVWPAFVERNFTYKKVKPLLIGHHFVALTAKGLKDYYADQSEVFEAWLSEQS